MTHNEQEDYIYWSALASHTIIIYKYPRRLSVSEAFTICFS